MGEEENLIKEINEEIKQDNYKKLWNKYGKYLIGLLIIIIFFVSSGTIYKNYKTNKIEKQSELYFQAIEFIKNEDYAKAEKILNEINNSKDSGYSILSALQIIHLKNKGKVNVNIENIILDKNPFFEDYFLLQKFNQNLNEKKNNILIDKIIKISRPGSPWRFTAHELLTAYYIKNNDLNSAIQSLNIITEDNEAPPFMKERALLLLESIKEN